jgi:hypothetical protein
MTNFDNCLSSRTVEIFDSSCGEPIKWGRQLIKYLGETEFDNLCRKHKVEYISESWLVIDKTLTRDEAIEKYGEITNEEFGPRGGWKSITFGNKKFISKIFKK